MRAIEFMDKLEQKEIVDAIREAERRTSGEIRVFISRRDPKDTIAAAQEQFHKLGMNKTAARNGVLIFVAPRMRQFAVIGDTGVHERCGNSFWQQVAAEMEGRFRQEEYTGGLLLGIRKAGELLARHFPARPGDTNELPNDIASD